MHFLADDIEALHKFHPTSQSIITTLCRFQSCLVIDLWIRPVIVLGSIQLGF